MKRTKLNDKSNESKKIKNDLKAPVIKLKEEKEDEKSHGSGDEK